MTSALGMAIDQRDPVAGTTVIHSDQGTQFTSWAFTQRAIDSGLLPLMGSVGDCYDNAMIESFWSRMQVELMNTRRWRTGSSWPARSSTTSRSGTTASAGTHLLA